MRTEPHNLHGTGDRDCEVYDMPPAADPHDYWLAVTDVPCPVKGCTQTVLWYEAGYVPGYRVCMAQRSDDPDLFDLESIRHRFLAGGDADHPTLIRDLEGECVAALKESAAAGIEGYGDDAMEGSTRDD